MSQITPILLEHQLMYPELGLDQQLQQTLLLTLTAQDIPLPERPPVTLMLCVDLSGSMMGKPLELLIESVRMLLNQLNEHDRLGMVTFSNRGRLVSPIRELDPEGRGFFLGVLSGIQASGSTNMEEGLRLALDNMPPAREGELTHIVLLSDGKPNRGQTESKALRKIVDQHRGETTLSSFGFGVKHDEDLLQKLARTGGGGYAYIEGAETAPLAFARELGGLFSMVGTDIHVLMRPAQGCSIIGIKGEQNIYYTAQGMQVDIPDMIAGQKVHLLFDTQLKTPSSQGTHKFAEVELRYTLPGRPPQDLSTAVALQYEASETPNLQASPILKVRLLLQEVSEIWEDAHRYADRKRFDKAIGLLKPLRSRLMEASRLEAAGEEVRNWYEQIIDEINILTQRPDEERYERVRKAAKSEMADPTGIFRRSNTSIANLNTTQRQLLSEMMLKAVGMPHGYLRVEKAPEGSDSQKGREFPILGETTVGRLGQLELDHPSVSKRHVRLVATPGGYLLIDLLSTNPPKINGKQVKGPTLLKPKDLIQIGLFELSFHMGIAPSIKNAKKKK